MSKQITYSKTVTVFEKDFYASQSNSAKMKGLKLSAKMKDIFNAMKDIAVPDFTEEGFIEFYASGFIRADMRYILDAKTNETIGFLFTSLHNRKVSGGRKDGLVGTAFPAIKKEFRNVPGYDYSRVKMYIKFIWYYLKYIMKIEGNLPLLKVEEMESLISEETQKPLFETLSLIEEAFKRSKIKTKMEIQINVENPNTFADICRFNLVSNFEIPRNKHFKRLLEMSKEDVVKINKKNEEDYTTMNKRPPEIIKAPFTVNIHDQKASNLNTNDPYKRHFIITNPEYPDYAFKFVIPVDKGNMINMLVKAWEMERKQNIIQFIDNYCSLPFIQQTIPSRKIKDLMTISTYLKTNKYHLLTDDQMKLLLDVLGYNLA
jgi:hypothetical protein